MMKDCSCLQTVTFILENMSLEVLKVMDSITGKMAQITGVSFYQEWGMEEEFGKWSMGIHMKVSTWMIKKMVREPISGRMDLAMKAISRMTTDMDSVKCVGKMAESIKETGWME